MSSLGLATIDWIVIAGYFVLSLGIGLAFSRRAGKSLTEFFISGRSLPWWIAGTSMVATTFAADTPLAVTGLVAKNGLAGNWFWWAYAFGGMFTVFVFSRLWRRSEVITDAEIVELRYSGEAAAVLRGFRAIYFAIPINAIIVGWVTKAMIDVLKHTILSDSAAMQIPFIDWYIIGGMLLIVGLYAALSGMWGVAITDFVQFTIAMTSCIILAVLAVNHVGGLDALQTQAKVTLGPDAFKFIPSFSGEHAIMPLEVFLIYLFVIWWASWYPGAEPGGGGYVVQRMASCKDERHSLLATLWFQVAHYCVRPWPWLLVAFAAVVMFPDIIGAENPGVGFPRVMKAVLPAGAYGLMIVAFFAAFMSTLSTQVNWGASYLVSDVYKRFMKPDANDRELAFASRVATVIVLLCGGISAYIMVERNVSVDAAWKFLAALGAGTGAVYILRWFWWRINAWSEISGMVASVLFFVLITSLFPELRNEHVLAIVALLTVVAWVAVTFLTQPTDSRTLDSFFRKIRPGGPGWGPVAARNPEVVRDKYLGLSILCAMLGVGIVFFTLPGVGLIIFGDYLKGLLCLGGAGACAAAIVLLLNRMGWEKMVR